jgi:hypothetical protein
VTDHHGGEGGKRKYGPTLVAAKGTQKKKHKGPQGKAGQRIASMVARDLKQMLKSEKDLDQEEESSNEKDDMSLFNLVREGSKKRVNFLVTSAEGGKEYVPCRYSTLMINAKEGKDGFKPRRGRSEKGRTTRSLMMKRERLTLASRRRRRSELPQAHPHRVMRPVKSLRGKSRRRVDQRSQISKLRLKATGVCMKAEIVPWTLEGWKHLPATQRLRPARPKKGGRGARLMPWLSSLPGVNDHQDDKRIDDEWGETQEKHDRRDHDKNVESGWSPPP